MRAVRVDERCPRELSEYDGGGGRSRAGGVRPAASGGGLMGGGDDRAPIELGFQGLRRWWNSNELL
jgi:hypothetical protein